MKETSFSETLQAGGEIHPPAADLVGFGCCRTGPGKPASRWTAGRRHHNPMGTVHGGILCTLADSAMGMAFATTLGDGETFTSLELKINFLPPVFGEKLYAPAAKVVHRGRSVGLVECDVPTEDGKLVARAVSTCSVHWRGQAKYMIGDTPGAIADYREALRLHPNWGPATQALQDLGVQP